MIKNFNIIPHHNAEFQLKRNEHVIIVFLIGHKARVGKDTVCEILLNHHIKIKNKEVKWDRIAFADELKNTVSRLYDFSHEQMYGNEKDIEDRRYKNTIDNTCKNVLEKTFFHPENLQLLEDIEYKEYFTPRRILQIFGQDQRKINPNIWADFIFNELNKKPTSYYRCIVIPDFRFKNEYEVAKRWKENKSEFNVKKSLYTVKINRDLASCSNNSDVSENDLNYFHWDYIIENNSSIEELEKTTIKLFKEILSNE